MTRWPVRSNWHLFPIFFPEFQINSSGISAHGNAYSLVTRIRAIFHAIFELNIKTIGKQKKGAAR
jgi:hypothetical protein